MSSAKRAARARRLAIRTPAGSPAQAAFARGVSLMRTGDFAAAEASYARCIAEDAAHGEAHRHLGLLAAKRGDMAQAATLLQRAVALCPDSAEARANLGTVLRQTGRSDEAADANRAAAALGPGNAGAHQQFGLVLLQQGKVEDAATAFALAAALDPFCAATHFWHAEALRRLGRFAEGLLRCEQGLALVPDDSEGLNARGLLREQLGDLAGAISDFHAALRGTAKDAIIHTNVALVHLKLHGLDEATAAAHEALRIDPASPAALGCLGTAYQRQGRVAEAIEMFSKAIDREPDCALHYSNLGALLVSIEQTDAAIAACRIGVSLAPVNPEVQFNLAVALRQKGLQSEAIAAYRQAHANGCAEALIDIGHLRQQICDWPGLAADTSAAQDATYRRGRSVPPFSVLTAVASPHEHRRAAEVYAAAFPRAERPLAAYAPRPTVRRSERIRVGYLSADFYQHATMSLLIEVLERHDRAHFDVRAYSYGPDDGSPLRRRGIAAFETFVDLRAASHVEAAGRIAADGIDILVDLKGYTQGARTEILVYRPAPIQVNYLGYPGTMGAPFIDYLIADRFVAPDAHAAQFSEKVVHLPHCYQPNDAARPMAALDEDRAAFGLPEAGFVFCSFNNTYKITPEVFDIWMRLVRATPDSVLWLLETSDTVVTNLRREAGARGVAPDRLIFAPRVKADRHIARMGLADLFLDTSHVNAHTTASEALWAGLPVLTCAGDSFVARVAGSLLHTIGMPELVTGSLADYEARALDLARDPARLAALRRRLVENRLVSPLFDSARYTRNFETALAEMQRLRDAGLPPCAFAVADA